MRFSCGVGTNLKRLQSGGPRIASAMGINRVSGGDRALHPSTESCDTYHGKRTMGRVRNLRPDLFTTLERPRGVTQSRPPGTFPEVSIRAARQPGTPWSVRAGPAPGLTQVQSPPTSPCLRRLSHPCVSLAPPSASVALSLSRGGASPAGPPHGLRYSPLTGRPRGVLGDRGSRENQARGAKADWIHDRGVAPWPTGGVNDREGRGLPAVTRRGRRDHSERGGALAVVSPEERGGGVRAKLPWLTLGRGAGPRREGRGPEGSHFGGLWRCCMGVASSAVNVVRRVEGGAVASGVGLGLLSLTAEREPHPEGWGLATRHCGGMGAGWGWPCWVGNGKDKAPYAFLFLIS